MGKIYFVSDLHFAHSRPFLYEPRGFTNIYDHDKAIIENWNKVITDDDTVYILGDIMLNDNEYGKKCFNQLTGMKIIIEGNHDTPERLGFYKSLRGVIDVKLADKLKMGKRIFYLTHYPMLIGPIEKRHGVYNLHGHIHNTDRFELMENRCYNVALDAHNMMPISIDEIIADINKYKEEHKKEE